MIISAVEERRKSLCAIYIDGELAVTIDKEVTLENRLQPGMEIDDERLFNLIMQSDIRRAKEKALWLISYRDYSKKEIYDKLIKDYSETAVENCIERLSELNLIDDEKFARKYAKDLFEIKKLSKSAVIYKLRQKGIDSELASEIAQELKPDEENVLSDLLNRKYFRSMFDEKGRKRVIGALQRAGYSYSSIKSAISCFDEENEIDKDGNIYE